MFFLHVDYDRFMMFRHIGPKKEAFQELFTYSGQRRLAGGYHQEDGNQQQTAD